MEHHTYRFARKAETEGIVVIDDPDSIMKCTNKIYLAELLFANKIPIPQTEILKKDETADIKSLESRMPYPIVLKIPDSSFSRGVHRVTSSDELKEVSDRLFAESDVILAQEYMYTDFDWRIGILNRRPVYACQYFMSRRHWQIMKHTESGEYTEGASKTWPVDEVPQEVVKTALAAANLIGDGFYGVDVKESSRGPVVIEINDNPSIDSGVEDKVLGDDLYRMVIEEFIRRLEIITSV
jgi:glutathione synthase/RimK-type ligase-like ATP-grasp enzyme